MGGLGTIGGTVFLEPTLKPDFVVCCCWLLIRSHVLSGCGRSIATTNATGRQGCRTMPTMPCRSFQIGDCGASASQAGYRR